VAIRWKDFPHKEIFADIHSRLNQNAVERTADDSLRHILRRRLHFLIPDEHSRFIQLESRHIVERLRCTRDAYRAFTDAQGCSPASEAYWVILRFSVLPTAVASLQRSVVDYARLTRVPGADLSLLFGILTEACHVPRLDGKAGRLDFDDRTPATNTEIQGLAGKVSEDTLLWLEDHRVGHPFGDGPFAADDASSIHRSWALCALPDQMTLIDWMPVREKLWRACVPWTEGLATLVGCVQDELLSQCFALSPDGQVRELRWKQQSPEFESVVVPEPTNQFIKVAGAWTVTFMGNTVRLPANIVGLDYVSAILRCEGRPIGALELLHVAGGHANSHAIENALDSLREEMDETDEGVAVVHSDLQQQTSRGMRFWMMLAGKDCKRGRMSWRSKRPLRSRLGTLIRPIGFKMNTIRLSGSLSGLAIFTGAHEYSAPRMKRLGLASPKHSDERTPKFECVPPQAGDHLKSAIATGSEFWYRDKSIKWKC
jgi:hypothetical protein